MKTVGFLRMRRRVATIALAPLLWPGAAFAQSLPETTLLDESAERAIPLLADPDDPDRPGRRTEIRAGIAGAREIENPAIGDELRATAALRHAVDLGPWRYGFIDAELIGWLPMPQPFESNLRALSGQIDAGAYVGSDDAGPLYGDVTLDGELDFSTDGTRGNRRLDVGPAPYAEVRMAPGLRLAHSDSGDERSYSEHTTATLGYELRVLRYFAPDGHDPGLPLGYYEPIRMPVEQRMTHRIDFGVGWSEHESEARPALDWGHASYAYTEQKGIQDRNAHQLEIEAFRGGVGVELGDDAVMHVDVGAGWAWRWWRADADPTHSFITRFGLGIVANEGNGGGVMFAHALEGDALGARALGVSSCEVKIHLGDDDFPIGGGLSSAFQRLNELDDDSKDDVFLARAGFELFARHLGGEAGASLSVGQGLPNGSAGWDAFASPEPPVYVLVGMFARGRGAF